MKREITVSFAVAIVLALSNTVCQAQALNEYPCNAGQCTEAPTHIINTPWSSTQTIEMGYYDLGNGVRRLGFCRGGVKTYAQSDLGHITVASDGTLSTDISLCGGSGIERIHMFHGTAGGSNYLQCGSGSLSTNRLRPIKLNHDVVVSTLNGTSSYVSLYFSGNTTGSDAQVTICGGNGADVFEADVNGYFSSFGGADVLRATEAGAWFFGGDGNDDLIAEGDSEANLYTVLCYGQSGTDECLECDFNDSCELP